ncbi:hypothetical protein LJC33_00330 [Eubacteriales bacterium OttesenSCG-928-N13]|nr:hypothetical protein [Eubacteriales bacterium OttesenSCG-928-N13]
MQRWSIDEFLTQHRPEFIAIAYSVGKQHVERCPFHLVARESANAAGVILFPTGVKLQKLVNRYFFEHIRSSLWRGFSCALSTA